MSFIKRFSPGWIGLLQLLLLVCAQCALAQAPTILTVTPANGATGISTNSDLVFVFDRDMDTLGVVPIASFPPALIGNFEVRLANAFFTGTWGPGKRTLTIKGTQPFPPDTLIEWTLNPPGGTLFPPLASDTKTPLATVSGNFRTAALPVNGPAPKLVSVTPAVGATNVPPTSPITFLFDLEMDTNVVLTASLAPILIGNYEFKPSTVPMSSGVWSADKRSLTFSPLTVILPGTTVSWALNPAGTRAPLTSAVGTPLATINGSYRIALNSGANTNETCGGTNVTAGYYTINKNIGHTQIAAGLVIPTGDAPAAFHAFANSPPLNVGASGKVLSASVTPPVGNTLTLSNLFGIGFNFAATPTTEALLDASYPPGQYQMRLTQEQVGGAPVESTVTMNMPAAPASIPTISNFAEAQTIDPAQNFMLRWNAFTPQRPGAFISVIIVDSFGSLVFQAPNFCVPRALAPTDTSVVIPANYFKAGFSYSATLQFGYNFYLSTNDVPKMSGFGSVSRATTFPLKAASGGTPTVLPATFLTYRLLPSGHPELTLSGTAGQSYAILRSPSLPGTAWTQVGTITMSALGTATYRDATAVGQLPAFYQAVGNFVAGDR